MARRQHPVHDTVAALTRVQRQHIEVTPTVSYRVEAPCLLQQLYEAVALGTEAGGRGVPGSRANIAIDALDLWREILHNTAGWADTLGIDRAPYRQPPPPPPPARAQPARQRPLPWLQALQLADDTPPEVLTAVGDQLSRLPTGTSYDPEPVREQIPNPDRIHQLPPVGRLLRAAAGTATSAGLDPVADAIHRNADRWRAQIEAMLHGVQEQRGVRGAICPACETSTVVDERDDGRYRIPAVVLVQREVAGEPLSWLACLACGWSRNLYDEQRLQDRIEAAA